MRLLLVEDDEPLAQGLAASLRLGGDEVARAATGRQALALTEAERFDAIVLDLNLPDTDGLTLMRTWRDQRLATPVLILSARDELADRVTGLDLGADDYLSKPFDLTELEARLRVLIRRTQAGAGQHVLTLGALTLDLVAAQAHLRGAPLSLTAKEFALLHTLALKEGQVLSKEQLSGKLTDDDQAMSANALDILIHRLRKKLDGSGLSLRTLRGFGYVLGTGA